MAKTHRRQAKQRRELSITMALFKTTPNPATRQATYPLERGTLSLSVKVRNASKRNTAQCEPQTIDQNAERAGRSIAGIANIIEPRLAEINRDADRWRHRHGSTTTVLVDSGDIQAAGFILEIRMKLHLKVETRKSEKDVFVNHLNAIIAAYQKIISQNPN